MWQTNKPPQRERDRPIRSRRVAAECPTFTDNLLGSPPWFRIIHSHSVGRSRQRRSIPRVEARSLRPAGRPFVFFVASPAEFYSQSTFRAIPTSNFEIFEPAIARCCCVLVSVISSAFRELPVRFLQRTRGNRGNCPIEEEYVPDEFHCAVRFILRNIS